MNPWPGFPAALLRSRWVLAMNRPPVTSPADHRPLVEPIRRPLDARQVAAVLDAIRTDSQRQPAAFLQTSVVPHGGE